MNDFGYDELQQLHESLSSYSTIKLVEICCHPSFCLQHRYLLVVRYVFGFENEEIIRLLAGKVICLDSIFRPLLQKILIYGLHIDHNNRSLQDIYSKTISFTLYKFSNFALSKSLLAPDSTQLIISSNIKLARLLAASNREKTVYLAILALFYSVYVRYFFYEREGKVDLMKDNGFLERSRLLLDKLTVLELTSDYQIEAEINLIICNSELSAGVKLLRIEDLLERLYLRKTTEEVLMNLQFLRASLSKGHGYRPPSCDCANFYLRINRFVSQAIDVN